MFCHAKGKEINSDGESILVTSVRSEKKTYSPGADQVDKVRSLSFSVWCVVLSNLPDPYN